MGEAQAIRRIQADNSLAVLGVGSELANKERGRYVPTSYPAMGQAKSHFQQRRALLRRSLRLGLISPPAVAMLSGCQTGDRHSVQTGASGKRFTISFVGTVLNNPFWDQVQKGATSAGKDLAGVDLTYLAPEDFSHANINQILKSAVSAKPDGIAIDYRGRMFEEVTRQALDQGAVVQFYNNFKGTDSSDPRIVRLARTAVGLDKYQAARRTAEAFRQFLSPGEPIVLFNGIPDSPEHLEIQNAYLDVLTEAGWSEAQLEKFPVTLDPAENYQLMKTYLAAHPETAGVICWDSVTGATAARAKSDAGLSIPIMSWNLDNTTIRAIKNGTLNLTLTQQPFIQGYYAVVGLYMKLKFGLNDPPLVDPASLIIDGSNIAEVESLYQAGIAG